MLASVEAPARLPSSPGPRLAGSGCDGIHRESRHNTRARRHTGTIDVELLHARKRPLCSQDLFLARQKALAESISSPRPRGDLERR